MSSLYADSSKFLLRLGSVRLNHADLVVTPDGRVIEREAYSRDPGRFDAAIEAGGGSFGGGGATGEWPQPEGAGEADWWPILVGDPDCPANGQKPEWVFHQAYENGVLRTYGPHNNGPFDAFYGLTVVSPGNVPPWSTWVLVDNSPNGRVSHPEGTLPPFCVTDAVGTGMCQLEPPESVPRGTLRFEHWQDTESKTNSGGYDHYRVCRGNLWNRDMAVCEPPHVEYFPVSSRPLDRKKVREAPEEEEEKDRALPIPPLFLIPPPPFIFTTTAGGPSGRPSLRRNYNFRARRPPRRRTRQPPKKKGPIQTIIKIVDIISEASEVVDCVFEALPKGVQKAWEKGRPNRGLLDQAGQFGIDGADWKGQAIWHNHKAVDWVKAFQCVSYNQFIEDRIAGNIAKGLPPGATTAVSRAAAAAEYKKERDRQKAKWARIRAENAARVAAGR